MWVEGAPSRKEEGTLLSAPSVHLKAVQVSLKVMLLFYSLLASWRLQPKITDTAHLILYPRLMLKEGKGLFYEAFGKKF